MSDLPPGVLGPVAHLTAHAAKRLPKFAYYPFGGGQRLCVGNAFALTEAATILPAVGQRYRFTLDPDAMIGIKPQITLLPANGIPATLRLR